MSNGNNAAEAAAAAADVCCANCGAAEVDDIILEECNDCDLVKYCSDKCREEHREQHEEACKNRKALLHDKQLFTQPDSSHHGECPICFLPLPLDRWKSGFWTCCSETICMGCFYANISSNKHVIAKVRSCPFCRKPMSSGEEEDRKREMKRVKANDPVALSQMGAKCYDEGDYDGAFEYYTKAAELGDIEAHYQLGCMYEKGWGVEKDEEKSIHHLEKAAIGGHPEARYNLACHEGRNGRMERAVKHFIIAANLGMEESMKALWGEFKDGNITKEKLDVTLRSHQAAIDAMKSAQRDLAERFRHLLGREN